MKFQIFAIFILSCNVTVGQTDLINELNKNILEIKTISPYSNLDDLKSYLPFLKQKQIVGLGETTHGTKEFFNYKHRLVKYLVTQADYKVFIIEGSFTGSQKMNDYILQGKGSINDALRGVGYGVWMTEEFTSFIEWMKQYNSTRDDSNKIRFYGCDLVNEVLTAKKLKDYLEENNTLTSLVEKGLNWIIAKKHVEKYAKDDVKALLQSLTELDSFFETMNNKNDNTIAIYKQEKYILEQFAQMLLANSSEKVMLRDKFMAENIEWILKHENNKKVIFWAHNEHIANNNNKKEQKPAGYYLKQKYENNYYAFGFGFYNGTNSTFDRKSRKWVINQIPDVSIKKSTDAVFKECKYPNFILDFASVDTNEAISAFLNTGLYRRAIGAIYCPEKRKLRNYIKGKLIDTFDGIIFFRETEASIILKK